jgi:predicted nucleotidyltransferase
MRLSKYEQNSIKKHFKNIFPNAKLYLFGSRVDDSKKGGDIDLYIETLSDEYSYPKLLSFNSFIQADIGEQKIDIVVNKIDKQIDKLIYTNAKKQGILLG